ncbi:MAG TPA: hypothetical protein VHC47_08145, partial [Mucilaginibacter sp.]|nr:hypothetical protein [Mucilaginibacter sp.]
PKQAPDPDMQALFAAREILTVNPWTISDFRKLMIDVNGVKNAWINCLQCPCDIFLYANCQLSSLQYKKTEHTVIIKGMYDVKVEFEDDMKEGDLNSGKILHTFYFLSDPVNNITTSAVIEMRLPTYKALQNDASLMAFFSAPADAVQAVNVQFISGNKTDNTDIPQADLGQALRRPLYTTFQISLDPAKANPVGGSTLTMQDVPFTVWFNSDADRKALQLTDLKSAIEDAIDATHVNPDSIIPNYFEKISAAGAIIAAVNDTLMVHRNLCEDFCTITAVETEDVAICADIDLTADSDIEEVLAQAYFLIDQYFSPDINFYSLSDMTAAGFTIDEIFNGPPLNSGFIKDDELQAARIKTELHASAIYAILMNIPGVLAVRNLIMSPYDSDGNRGAGQAWILDVDAGKQARLYLNGSKFLVFKNGLPFLPDKEELEDTLNVIEGSHLRPKFAAGENDLPVPQGTYYQLTDYYPVQYSLPQTYGVSYYGLPANATIQRVALAKQLKAYLLFYEQLLRNYLEQLSHFKDLLSLDESIDKTYFNYVFTDADIKGISEVYDITGDELQALSEDQNTFLDRRNRFLDHLMARFAESFNDYALMLYSYTDSKKVADEILIKDKIAFIKDIPFAGSNRARAYNYKDSSNICNDNNIAGLKKRIEQVLGLKQFDDYVDVFDVTDSSGNAIKRPWYLIDDSGVTWLVSKADYLSYTPEDARVMAKTDANDDLPYLINAANYQVKKSSSGKWIIVVNDAGSNIIAQYPNEFSKNTDATAYIATIVAFVNGLVTANKIFIVEHLLLRPRNRPGTLIPNGDALLPICISADCNVCGDEDPYSYRLTIVMNGEKGLANSGIEFRRFAENTIRMEVPAHLAPKICWVSDVQLQKFETLYCTWESELAKASPDAKTLSNELGDLITEFGQLKNVYPKATLHDCVDGDDQNRVYLNQTVI